MNVILHATQNFGTDGTLPPRVAPVYQLYIGDEKGTDVRQVAIITPQGLTFTDAQGPARLASLGLSYSEETKTVVYSSNQERLKSQLMEQLTSQMELSVEESLSQISVEERDLSRTTFQNRTLLLTKPIAIVEGPKIFLENFYDNLPDNIREALSKTDFIKAFDQLSEATLRKFMDRVVEKQGQISYLDLPLRAALIINQKLQKDPWKTEP